METYFLHEIERSSKSKLQSQSKGKNRLNLNLVEVSGPSYLLFAHLISRFPF